MEHPKHSPRNFLLLKCRLHIDKAFVNSQYKLLLYPQPHWTVAGWSMRTEQNRSLRSFPTQLQILLQVSSNGKFLSSRDGNHTSCSGNFTPLLNYAMIQINSIFLFRKHWHDCLCKMPMSPLSFWEKLQQSPKEKPGGGLRHFKGRHELHIPVMRL